MADLKKIKHIFFDLDDTLWDYDRNSRKVLEELFGDFNLSAKLQCDFDNFFTVYKKINLELWSLFYKRQIDKHGLRESRWQKVFTHFNYPVFEEHAKLSDYFAANTTRGTCLKEGCIDTLAYLQKNYKLHIITNGFKEFQHIKIDGSGLRGYFENIIISEEQGLVKPEEQIFRYAEGLAGCNRHEAVMVGDSLESDVEGALNAGWEAIYLTSDPGEYKGRVISALGELKGMF